ncbi:MAG: DUF5125 domain-containing protein [Bacteroidales bacterium]|nr:DUF5125 domain-containing protein [Bacteroidales bacterium]
MKRIFKFIFVAAATILAASCDPKQPDAVFGLTEFTLAESAEFGENVDFTVTAPIATNVTVTIVKDGAQVATATVREAVEDVFSGAIAVPYTKNMAAGAYDVLIMATGSSADRAEQTAKINLSHPAFTSVAIVAESRIELTKGEGNVWSYTGELPASLTGYFEAKTADATYTFGGNSLDNVAFGSTEAFNIYEYESPLTNGTVSFDIVSFAVKYPLEVKTIDVPATTDAAYPGTLEIELKKGALYEFNNLGDLWVDVDFFETNEEGGYTFRAESGRYKLTNQADWGSLRVERITSTGAMAEFHWDDNGNITTNEAIWCLGNYNFGKPDKKPIREGRAWNDWETFDGLCMAKIDDYKYQITLRVYNFASYKFFQTKLNWGDVTGANYDLANSNLNGLTNIITGPNNNGNFLQSIKAAEGDHTYDITTDPDVILYPEEGTVIRFTFDVTNPKGIVVTAEDVTDLNLM